MNEQPMSRSGYFMCDLVPHPEGHFQIGGILYRPEWGRAPIVGVHDALIERMIGEGVKVGNAFYATHKTLPDRVRVEALEPEGVLDAKVVPRGESRIISFRSW